MWQLLFVCVKASQTQCTVPRALSRLSSWTRRATLLHTLLPQRLSLSTGMQCSPRPRPKTPAHAPAYAPPTPPATPQDTPPPTPLDTPPDTLPGVPPVALPVAFPVAFPDALPAAPPAATRPCYPSPRLLETEAFAAPPPNPTQPPPLELLLL